MADELRLRIKSLIHRRRLDADLEDERAFHLAMREEKYRAAGATSREDREQVAGALATSPCCRAGRDRKYMSLSPVLIRTHVTCVKTELTAYSSHLPQNLGDRAGRGYEGLLFLPSCSW